MNRFVFLKWALPLAALSACRTATERELPPDGGAAGDYVTCNAISIEEEVS